VRDHSRGTESRPPATILVQAGDFAHAFHFRFELFVILAVLDSLGKLLTGDAQVRAQSNQLLLVVPPCPFPRLTCEETVMEGSELPFIRSQQSRVRCIERVSRGIRGL